MIRVRQTVGGQSSAASARRNDSRKLAIASRDGLSGCSGRGLRWMPADHDQYFKYYCVSVNLGTLSAPFTLEARIRSTASHPDPPSTVLDQLNDLPARFVPASECEQTKGDYDIIHRATKRKPALLVVVGPVEVVSETEVRARSSRPAAF